MNQEIIPQELDATETAEQMENDVLAVEEQEEVEERARYLEFFNH